MLCPYRVKTVFEYGVIDGTLVKSEERTEFEECNMSDCPLYSPVGFCVRAEKEKDAEEY